MDDTLVRDALRAHVHDGEPPLRLTSAALVRGGRRSRRLRALAGGGGALVAAGLAGTLALAWPTADTTFQVAAPPPADCSGPMSDSTAPEWLGHRLTCYLTDACRSRCPAGASVDPVEAGPRRRPHAGRHRRARRRGHREPGVRRRARTTRSRPTRPWPTAPPRTSARRARPARRDRAGLRRRPAAAGRSQLHRVRLLPEFFTMATASNTPDGERGRQAHPRRAAADRPRAGDAADRPRPDRLSPTAPILDLSRSTSGKSLR